MAKRRVKLGQPLGLSDAELEDLAKITDEDIQQAQKGFKKAAPRWAKNLLLAGQPEALKE